MNQPPQQLPGPNHNQQPPPPNTPQTLATIENTLIKLIDLCHTNTTMLENWKTTDQTQLWANIDQYIATLGQLYDGADQLPLQYTTTRKTLLCILWRTTTELTIFKTPRDPDPKSNSRKKGGKFQAHPNSHPLHPHLSPSLPSSIDSGINPLSVLRAQVDASQERQDLVRGQMAQAEIFRETFDNLLAQWMASPQAKNRLKAAEQIVKPAYEKKTQKAASNRAKQEQMRLYAQYTAQYKADGQTLTQLQPIIQQLQAQIQTNPELQGQLDQYTMMFKQVRARAEVCFGKITAYQEMFNKQQQQQQQQQQQGQQQGQVGQHQQHHQQQPPR